MRLTSASVRSESGPEPKLPEIFAALSFALDLTEGVVPGHALRTCLLALRLGEDIGLRPTQLNDLYYAALLKDVGCSSNAARICQIIGGDDRLLKAGTKLVDWTSTRPDLGMIRLLWKEVLPGAGAAAKLGRMLKLAAHQRQNNREMIALRCDRGASITRKMGFGKSVAESIASLDEHWDGSGYPEHLRGQAIPLASRILLAAQHLDVFASKYGPGPALETLARRSGRWYDPALVRAAHALHRHARLWANCLPGYPAEQTHAAALRVVDRLGTGAYLPAAPLDSICEAFAEVVDAKSPFTFRHSLGVTEAAVRIGRTMGLPAYRLTVLRRAALLHDVGKLSVPNTILDKPGSLEAAEFAVVKGHSAMSRSILARMQGFGEIAVLAGEHHERLDGSGYPLGLRLEHLSLESRLLAVADVYGAMAEQRPYREGLPVATIAGLLQKDADALRLDRQCVEAAIACAGTAATPEPPPSPGAGSQEVPTGLLHCSSKPAPSPAPRSR